ncbi:MAG: hypothetical protein ABWY93_20245 [Mycobacterium sp.]
MFDVHSASPAVGRAIPRRNVLMGAAGILGLALLAEVASACASDAPPPPVDPLLAQADAANADSELARAAATAAPPALVPALTQVVSERAQHARALTEEVARLAGGPAPTTDATSTTSAAPTTSAAATPPPSVNDVVAALKKSADSATALATTLTGYRAGLLGSIAASCTTAYVVGLPLPQPAP